MPLSAAGRRGLYSPHSAERYIGLIRIIHPDFGVALRFANNRTDVVSRGDIYDGVPFDTRMPPQIDGIEPTIEITAQNVDRTIEAALASLTSEPTFVHEIIRASTPNVVEMGPWRLPLRSSRSSMGTLILILGGSNPILTKACPRAYFSQQDFPGLSRT